MVVRSYDARHEPTFTIPTLASDNQAYAVCQQTSNASQKYYRAEWKELIGEYVQSAAGSEYSFAVLYLFCPDFTPMKAIVSILDYLPEHQSSIRRILEKIGWAEQYIASMGESTNLFTKDKENYGVYLAISGGFVVGFLHVQYHATLL